MASTSLVLQQTAERIALLSVEYRGEIPQQIHVSGLAQDGSPEWRPDFSRWVSAREVIDTPRPESATPEARLRVTKALRRLRKEAIREFEVIYRVMILGEQIEETTRWLNERAARNGIPLPTGRHIHYRAKDTAMIVFSGIDKIFQLWL